MVTFASHAYITIIHIHLITFLSELTDTGMDPVLRPGETKRKLASWQAVSSRHMQLSAGWLRACHECVGSVPRRAYGLSSAPVSCALGSVSC